MPVSLAYLLIEFAIGMRINTLAWEGGLPLILLPLAAQAVVLLPRVLAGGMCVLVIAGVSGNLSWVPAWPHWLRNIAQATAAVVFVVVYVGVAQREREARQRTEALAAEVAQLAAANERNRMAREIHDTLGHYLTVIHVQLEAARAVIGRDPERGMLAVTRAQALAKDGLTAVRQSVKALREERSVDGIAEQIASLVDSVRDERFSVTLRTRARRGRSAPRSRSPCIAPRSRRSPTSASTPTPRTSRSSWHFATTGWCTCASRRWQGRDGGTVGTGFGLRGIRERAEQLKGSANYRMAPNEGFTLVVSSCLHDAHRHRRRSGAVSRGASHAAVDPARHGRRRRSGQWRRSGRPRRAVAAGRRADGSAHAEGRRHPGDGPHSRALARDSGAGPDHVR